MSNIYINGGKAPGAVSGNLHSPMAATRARVRSENKSEKWESQKEGSRDILVPTGLQIGALGR